MMSRFFMPFVFLLFGVVPLLSGQASGDSVLLGDHEAIVGRWTESLLKVVPGTSGTITFQQQRTATFFSDGVITFEVNHRGYSDGRTDQRIINKGTYRFNDADSSITASFTEQNHLDSGWIGLVEPIHTEYRNLVMAGHWYPDTWIKIGSGEGLNGTWESPVLSTEPKTKYRLTMDGNQYVLATYEVDSQNLIGSLVESTGPHPLKIVGSELYSENTSKPVPFFQISQDLIQMSSRDPSGNQLSSFAKE